MARNKVFVSYSRKNPALLERLQIAIAAPLRGAVSLVWYDERITAGDRWRDKIAEAVAESKVAILLVTPEYLASPFIWEDEIYQILAAHQKDGLKIVWVAASTSSYEYTFLRDIECVNEPNRPLDRLSPARRNEVWVRIAKKVMQLLGPEATASEAAAPPRLLVAHDEHFPLDSQFAKDLASGLRARGAVVTAADGASIAPMSELQAGMRASDAVVVLVSAQSCDSEVLEHYVRTAQEAQTDEGRPALAGVRLEMTEPAPGPLAVVTGCNALQWKPGDPLSGIIDSLLTCKSVPKTPARLTIVGTDDRRRARVYVEREADRLTTQAMSGNATIVRIKGGRSMGKTELLGYARRYAHGRGNSCVITNLQRFNASQLSPLEALYETLIDDMCDQLQLEGDAERYWVGRDSPNDNLHRFLRRQALGRNGRRIVWILDEVDRLFQYRDSEEFFGLVRAWHEEVRMHEDDTPFSRLTMLIAYAADADLFIRNPYQSPFNVGIEVRLGDFTPKQLAELSRQLGFPLSTIQLNIFYELLGGHPGLCVRGLTMLRNSGPGDRDAAFTDFTASAPLDKGPFRDHLWRLFAGLAANPSLALAVKRLIRGEENALMREEFLQLSAAGVVTGDSSASATIRCRLYQLFLERELLNSKLSLGA